MALPDGLSQISQFRGADVGDGLALEVLCPDTGLPRVVEFICWEVGGAGWAGRAFESTSASLSWPRWPVANSIILCQPDLFFFFFLGGRTGALCVCIVCCPVTPARLRQQAPQPARASRRTHARVVTLEQGVFTARNGPAAGMECRDVGVRLDLDDVVDGLPILTFASIGRAGAGNSAARFGDGWDVSACSTAGYENTIYNSTYFGACDPPGTAVAAQRLTPPTSVPGYGTNPTCEAAFACPYSSGGTGDLEPGEGERGARLRCAAVPRPLPPACVCGGG